MAKGPDERIRELERDLARDPGDKTARLALARELDRARRRAEAARHVEEVLAQDPLHEGALAAVDAQGLSPLGREAPWPTVHGSNDRARRSPLPGARKGRLARRIRIGLAIAGGARENATSLTVGGAGATYLATTRGRLVALDVARGEPRWVRDDFRGEFVAPSVGAGERLALAADGAIHLLDGRTGATLWSCRTRGSIDERLDAPTFAPRRLVLHARASELVAVDATTGKPRWKFETRGAASAPAVAGERIYVACSHGLVHELDLDGRVMGEARAARTTTRRQLVVLPDAIYLGHDDPRPGVVHVLARREGEPLGGRSSVVKLDGMHSLACALGPARFLVTGEHPGTLAGGVASPAGVDLVHRRGDLAADSAGCLYGFTSRGRLVWHDPTLRPVVTIDEVAAGPLVVGPDSTLLVVSLERGIVQVVA